MRVNCTNGQLLCCLIGMVMLVIAPVLTYFAGLYTGSITFLAGTALTAFNQPKE